MPPWDADAAPGEDLLTALLQVAGAVVATDRAGRVRICTEEATALLGPLLGLDAVEIDRRLQAPPALAEAPLSGPLTAALTGRFTRSTRATALDQAGALRPVLIEARPLDSPDGTRLGAMLTMTPALSTTPTAGDPVSLGLHDVLTGLPNRRLLADRLTQTMARCRRTGSRFFVLMIDLDHFKAVNDEFGHEYGDQVLREIGSRLRHAIRPTDTLARLGGDEFVAICEVAPVHSEIERLAARLVAVCADPVEVQGVELTVGASIGVTLATPELDLDGLLRQADLAMYATKRGGRGGWLHYDEQLARSSTRRAHLTNELRAALNARELEVAYQCEVRLHDGSLSGYEALIRWDHPDLGVVGAEELISIAERTDLMVPIGAFVLNHACAVAARQPVVAGVRPLTMSVNVSGRELADPAFANRVTETLRRWDLPGERLILEITETALLDITAAAQRSLNDVRAAGVALSIDDFGTGFASLTYLQRLPVQQVKIDQSFVAGLPESRSDDVIVTSVIALAHNLDLSVVAEGIETPAQAAFLRSLGCDLGQGYLFGRPMPGAG